VRSPAQVPKWHWHRWTVEGTIRQLALQPSPQPENSLPLIRQTSHQTLLFVLPSSYWPTLQIEKAVSQPKRLKERNSEGVKGLPS
jgi:hypothetical protein